MAKILIFLDLINPFEIHCNEIPNISDMIYAEVGQMTFALDDGYIIYIYYDK
jgi:hypothetical protein